MARRASLQLTPNPALIAASLLEHNSDVFVKAEGGFHDGDVEVCGRNSGNVYGVDGDDGMLGDGDGNGGDVVGCVFRRAVEDHLSGFKGE